MSIPRGLVCEELHQVRHDGEPYWLHITITASPVMKASNDPLPSPPFPVRADLGSQIADLIRADTAGGAGGAGSAALRA